MRAASAPRVARAGVPPTRPASPGALLPCSLGVEPRGGVERSGGTPLDATRGPRGTAPLPSSTRSSPHVPNENLPSTPGNL